MPRAREAVQPDAAACRHFLRTGVCSYGDACRFSHAGGPTAAAAAAAGMAFESREAYSKVEARLNALRTACAPPQELREAAAELRALQAQFRALAAADAGGAYPRTKRPPKANGARAAAFRRFLMATFGAEALRAGSGVLDVAGGQGTLSFELLNCHRVPVTVLDPRPKLNLRRAERRWAQRAGARGGEAGGEAGDEAVGVQFEKCGVCDGDESKAPRAVRPRHWPVYWQDALWRPLLGVATGEEEAAVGRVEEALRFVPQQRGSSRRTRKQPRAIGEVGDGSDGDDVGEDEGEGEGEDGPEGAAEAPPALPTGAEAFSTLRDCSAIVGMHPDSATESIVDFALAAGKPFAIVPCCVFAVDFPTRREPGSSRPVTSHAAFVRYLAAKAPGRIALASLPFAGKNTVLFSHGAVVSLE